MEKLKSHYSLSRIHDLVRAGHVMTTYSSLRGAAALDMGFDEMLSTVLNLKPTDFYKFMTTHANHRVWQDVYRPETACGPVYLKLTVTETVLIVSFKER